MMAHGVFQKRFYDNILSQNKEAQNKPAIVDDRFERRVRPLKAVFMDEQCTGPPIDRGQAKRAAFLVRGHGRVRRGAGLFCNISGIGHMKLDAQI